VSWQRRDAILGKVQIGSIGLYLACLAGYAVPPVARLFADLHDAAGVKVVEVAGLVSFCLFAAATLLIDTGEQGAAEDEGKEDDAPVAPN
jgi:hypothetical protein